MPGSSSKRRKDRLRKILREASATSSLAVSGILSAPSSPYLAPSSVPPTPSPEILPVPGEGSLVRAEDLLRDSLKDFEPPRTISVSEWADEYLYLSPEYAAQAGKWQTLPFQKEPLDCVSNPRVEQVVIKSCVQLMKTMVISCSIGWVIDTDPGPILVVQPREKDATSFSKERIAPMLRDTPRLHGKVTDKSRASDNTIEEKWFRGGMLAVTSAGSPGNLARRATRFLFCDEEDKWVTSAGVEGSPFSLAEKRTATFRHRRKIIRCCSPTRLGSPIDTAYEKSDQRQFHIPCPYCGEFQSLMGKFHTNVVWDSNLPTREAQASSAKYRCEHCSGLWNEAQRQSAIEKGKWIAEKPFHGVAGFWISELYSPWKTLQSIVLNFLSSKDNQMELVPFINTSLAENWADKGEAPDWQRLLNRRESYPVGIVPFGAYFLTAGVDIQKNRIEVEVVGWGRNCESWSVQYEIIDGDTGKQEVWNQLDIFLAKQFPHATGKLLPIALTFVDSSGLTSDVYRWARTQNAAKVQLIKGDDHTDLLVGQPSPVDVSVNGKKIRTGLLLRRVKVSSFKQELYGWLAKDPPSQEELAAGAKFPLGYCHFPDGPNYGEAHFQQLCAEQLTKIRNPKTGAIRYGWQLVTPNAKNEALDTKIYSRAAAWQLGMDRVGEAQWKRLEEQLAVAPVAGRQEGHQASIGDGTPASGQPPLSSPSDPNAYWRKAAEDYWARD